MEVELLHADGTNETISVRAIVNAAGTWARDVLTEHAARQPPWAGWYAGAHHCAPPV